MIMYKITENLDVTGFSINSVETVVKRNNGLFNFNSLEYFVIYIAYTPANLIVEGRRLPVQANHLVFIAPYKNIVFDANALNNIVIAFSSSFYEKSAKDSFILNSDLFFSEGTDAFIAPSIGSGEEIKKLIEGRLQLYRQKETGLYIAVAHNCVEILLLDGLLEMQSQWAKPAKFNFSYLDVVNRFRVLIQRHFKAEKAVTFYADKLGVSAQRLSVMTELILGKGAKRIILDKVVAEAVKLLQYSNLTVSEIAMNLGFADEGNFSAFIKKHTDKTPTEIRESSNVNI